ncbi:MAG: VanZ family protein [Desulfobacteraceae bacterium]|nr:MAG: VanZ family protein [Desulfobacteraceae bacterium]
MNPTNPTNPTTRFLYYWLPVIVWCAVIFAQSAFSTPDLVPDVPNIDKFLHAGVYGLLGFLLARAFGAIPGWSGKSLRLIASATIFTALYGLSDEWHQSFVAARTAEAADLMADLVGGFIGGLAYVSTALLSKKQQMR